VALGSNAIAWEHRIDDVLAPRLAYRRGSGRWLVTGTSGEDRIVAVEGIIDGSDPQRREWNLDDQHGVADAWAIQGDTVLFAHRSLDFEFGPMPGSAWSLTMMAMLDQIGTRVTKITPAGPTEIAASQLDTTCSDRALEGDGLICTTFDGARTQLFTLTPGDATPQSIGSIAGHFISYRPARDGWLSGWVYAGMLSGPTQLAVDLVSRRAITLPGDFRADEITVAGRTAATLHHDAASTRVRLYPIQAP
jgi:hypothetical protein